MPLMSTAPSEAAAGFYALCDAFFAGDQPTAQATWHTLPRDSQAFQAGAERWFADWAAANPHLLNRKA